MNHIVHRGLDPIDASSGFDSDYEQLAGNQFQIRLGGGQRMTFFVNRDAKTVRIHQVGGHTP